MTDRFVFTGVEDEVSLEAQGLEVVVAADTTEIEGGFGNDLLNADDDHGVDASTSADDVFVEGRIITGENFDASTDARGLEGDEGIDFVQVNGSNTADEDGGADVVVAAGPGGGSHVKVFDGVTGDSIVYVTGGGADTVIERSTDATPYGGFSGGVFVAAGDIDGDAASTDLAYSGAEATAFQRNNLGLFTLDIGTVETIGADSVDPVLMVISNQDFWYNDYADTRAVFDDVDIVHTEAFEAVDLF